MPDLPPEVASPWWRGAVLYQIYPRSFADADGDGIGDLPGLLARLDHVAALGVDAIWLCPVYASPQRDFGYDVADHCAIDPVFGALADLDRLIAAAQGRGLRVLVDLVAGHTSDAHPWFAAARRSRDAPTADWHVWADPAPDGGPPNNWLSVFGGPAWTWEPRRRRYYLHHFLAAQPALDLTRPAVAAAILDIARFWLARGVDGFRIDAVDFLAHDPTLPSNPPAPVAAIPAKPFGMQLHLHDMLHPAGEAFLHALRAVLDRHGAIALGELSSQPGAFNRIAALTGGAGPLHLAYTLQPLRQGFDAARVRALVAEAVRLAPGGGACWSLSNHDVVRVATRWAPAGEADARIAKLWLALLLALPGAVCLYQGEELGLPDAVLPEAALRDPFGIAVWPEFPGRDGSRTPMPWQAAASQAGFTTGTPWLPIPDAHRALAVDLQAADPASTLQFARLLLRLRRATPALRGGDAALLDLPAPLCGLLRGGRVAVLCNLSDEAVTLPATLAEATPLAPPLAAPCGVLPPWGAAWLALR